MRILICKDHEGHEAGFAASMMEIEGWAHAHRNFAELIDHSDGPSYRKCNGMEGHAEVPKT